MPDTYLERIVVWAAVDGHPFRDAWVNLAVPVWSKNTHNLLFGPTGGDGSLVISIEDIRAGIRRDAGLFPMDYTGDVAWGWPFSIELLNADAARRAIQAIDLWGLDATYPGRREQLAEFAETGATLVGRARIEASVVPEGSAKVAVQRVPPGGDK